jgi:DNA-binding beta-propeller fold protein YncE
MQGREACRAGEEPRRERRRGTQPRARIAALALLLLPSPASGANRPAYVAVRAPAALTVLDTATGDRVSAVVLDEASRYGPTDVAAPPAGSTAFVAHDCEVVLVDAATDTVRARVPAPDSYCAYRIATDARGSVVVAADPGGPVVWMVDAAEGRVTARSAAFADAYGISGLAVSGDGSEAIVVVEREEASSIAVLDTATGAVLRQREVGVVEGEIVISADGETIYVGDGTRPALLVLEHSTLDTVASIALDEPQPRPGSVFRVRGLAVAPGVGFVAIVLTEPFSDQTVATTVVQLRDSATHALIHRITIDAAAGRPAVDPDTGLVYVPIRDALGRVAVIDPAAGEIVETVPAGEEPVAIAIGPGRPVAPPSPTPSPTPALPQAPAQLCAYVAHPATNDAAGALTVINAGGNAFSRWSPIGRPPADPWSADGDGANGVALSPDGRSVYVTTNDALLVLDAATGATRNRIAAGSVAGGIAVRPDGAVAYVSKGGAIGVVDLAAEIVIDAFFTQGTPKDIAFTPDGDLAYVSRMWDSDSVLVVDARRHAVMQTIPVGDGSGYIYTWRGNHVAVAPDGRTAYVAVDHSSYERPSAVAVIDRETQRVHAAWPLPLAGAPGGIAVHPDGTRLYVAVDPRYSCRDDPLTGVCVYRHNVIAVLEAVSGRVLATLPLRGHPSELAASPDGSVLYVTDSWRGVATAIDPNTYAILASITIAGTPDFFVVDRVAVGLASGGCPLAGGAAPLPTRTFTATWVRPFSPTPAATGSPRATSTATATPLPCTGPCTSVELSRTRGRPGERVEVEARLSTGGLSIASVSSRIEWDTAIPIPERLQSMPDCVAESRGALFSFGPSYFSGGYGPFGCWPGYDCRHLQARVPAPVRGEITDGALLYRCTVAIDPEAAPGRHLLRLRGLAVRDTSGGSVAARGVDGAVDVITTDEGVSGASGCAVEPGHRPGAAWLAAVALLAVAAGRHRRVWRVGNVRRAGAALNPSFRTRRWRRRAVLQGILSRFVLS